MHIPHGVDTCALLLLDPFLVVDSHAVHHRTALLLGDELVEVAKLDHSERACEALATIKLECLYYTLGHECTSGDEQL